MKKQLGKILIIPLMLLSALLAVPGIPYAHAAGLICMAATTDTGCPALPPAFDEAPGSLLRVAVRGSGVDSFNGFDIQLGSDPTVLTGVGVDLTGSIIPFSTLALCVNGVAQAGLCTPQDADGIIHLAAVNTAGATTAQGSSGLLFTAIFKVVAGSPGVSISFNTGCSGTSMDPVCVTIASGTPGAPPVPVGIQEATFSHGPDYGFTITPTSTTVAPGANAAFTITLTSQGGFTDTISLSGSSSMGATPSSFDCNSGNAVGGLITPALNVSFDVSSVLVPSGGSATATLTAGAAAQPNTDECDVNGNSINLFPVYIITATGTSSSSVSHTATATLQDTFQDFSMSASPANGIVVPFGGSRTSTLTLTSISAFADSVSFSTSTNIAGPTASVSPSSVTLTAFGTATATLTINVPSTADFAAYDTTVTATATVGGQVHTVDVTYVVTGTDFNLAAVPDHIVTLASLAGSSNIKISSPLTFAGPLSYSAVVIPTQTNTPANCSPNCSTALGTSFSPTSGTLAAGGLTITTLTISTTANSALGNYTIIVTVTSGSITHRVFVTLALGDFSVALSSNALTVIPGTAATPKIIVTDLGGFSNTNFIFGQNGISFFGATNPEVTRVPQLPGNPALRLVQVFYPNGTLIPNTIVFIHGVRTCADCGTKGPIASVPKRQVFIDPFSPVATTTLTVRVTAATPPGDYVVSVTGIGGPILHTTTANVHVPQMPQFTQFVPFHKLSISGSGGTLTTKGGVINTDSQTTLFVRIQVVGISSDGTKTFTASSAVIALAPGQTVNNIPYTALFGPQTVGTTYSYTGSVQYGLSATALTASSSGGVSNSGTLFVIA